MSRAQAAFSVALETQGVGQREGREMNLGGACTLNLSERENWNKRVSPRGF